MEKKLSKKKYEKLLEQYSLELVKMQEWVAHKGLRVVVLFEGRDAAGKGGTIKRIAQPLNPRYVRIAALPKPTEKEKGEWYFQRYVHHLPTSGEIVLFDRSWYNRAGVERVMNFCTQDQYEYFLNNVVTFEKLLIDSGIILIKYWFSVSDEEQEKRFQDRMNDEMKRWKLSEMDLTARSRWVDYSKAKDMMFTYTDKKESPWYVIESDIKRNARINCISHLLSKMPYEDLEFKKLTLPERQKNKGYVRPPIDTQCFVPDVATEYALAEQTREEKKVKKLKNKKHK